MTNLATGTFDVTLTPQPPGDAPECTIGQLDYASWSTARRVVPNLGLRTAGKAKNFLCTPKFRS